MLPDATWSARLSEALDSRVQVAFATAPLAPGRLTERERAQLEALEVSARAQWLLGRAAVRALVPEGTEAHLPGPRLSLSHSGGVAVAVALEEVEPGTDGGVGVDLELEASPRLEAARFFLTPSEQGWVRTLPVSEQSPALRRLWTVKEALFKADLDNRERLVGDYSADWPAARAGLASGPRGRFRYASLPFAQGDVTVALSLAPTRDAHRGGPR